MPRKEYKVIHGDPTIVTQEMNRMTDEGWRPMFMSATSGVSVIVCVMLERSLNLSKTPR